MNGPEVDQQLVDRISSSLRGVRDAIASVGRDPDTVAIVGVTKGFGPTEVLAAYHAGLRLFGENYADELVIKAEALSHLPDLRWTFQGRLQSNKINRLRSHIALWQTVFSMEQVEALAKRVPAAEVLVQLNLTGSETQGGCSVDQLGEVLAHAGNCGLQVCGLMGIGPDTDDYQARRSAFAVLRAKTLEYGLIETSMGMSGDYLDAVTEGATLIRLGSTLFGERPAKTV